GASWSDTTDLSAGAFQSDIENIRSWFADGIIPIGIEEQADNKKPENNSGFMIYPNPVAGESITLDCSNPSNEKARYIIFDSQGRQIKSGILTNGHRQKISVDGLEKGAYLIKLRGTHVNDQALFIKM
ncbi:MAG: T9SS type A sorting domain-containing protein, partial [Bacteroidota bacterium]|nr:T9SS type A sorting domain-containing protein [Bacteroidota bacterium]